MTKKRAIELIEGSYLNEIVSEARGIELHQALQLAVKVLRFDVARMDRAKAKKISKGNIQYTETVQRDEGEKIGDFEDRNPEELF